MIKAARKYKIKFIRSQNVLKRDKQSLTNKLYRLLHQQYLKFNLNTTDGLFEPLINTKGFESNYIRLRSVLKQQKSVIEIMLHLESNSPEIKFFRNPIVIKELNRHKLISYNDLYKT
jgi:hypothetical protein